MIDENSSQFIKRKFKCAEEVGLHARPATVFVNQSCKFCSEIELVKNNRHVNAKSIMGVLSLGVSKGDEFEIWCSGDDYDKAMEALIDIFETQHIAELLNDETNEEEIPIDIEAEVKASFDYLKRFNNEDFMAIITGVCHRFAEAYELDLNELKEKL